MQMKRSDAIRYRRMIEQSAAGLSDKDVSNAPEMLPRLRGRGALVRAGTRINWAGQVKRAAADLWDTPENTPDAALNLWESVDYVNGVRVIPEHISTTAAFAEGEEGIDAAGTVWVSKVNNNVYTPAQYPDNWTKKEGTT